MTPKTSSKPAFSRRAAGLGITLIELGMVMVFVSLAMVPIIKTMGGPQSSSGEGNVTRVVAQKSKEMLLANTLLEQALSSDFSSFACGGTFNPQAGLPAPGASVTLPAASRCVSNNYNRPLYYQWTIRNIDNTGIVMPTGNHYYQAVVNVWNTPNGGTPLLTLPTSIFWNESGGATAVNKTGIVIVLDTSGSMHFGKDENVPPQVAGPGSPYLNYRFTDPTVGYTPPASIALNVNNNAELDIVSALDADDPLTAWDDRYPSVGSLGVTACNGASPLWNNTGGRMPYIREVCQANGGPTGAAWKTAMDGNLSRLEAARSSLLSFLLSLEADSELYMDTKLGLVTFSTGVTTQVQPMEPVNGSNRFPNMRRRLTWLNRNGAGLIPPNGSTNMYGGLQRGADVIFGDASLDNRIIFFVGDGAPTVAPTNHGAFQALSNSIGDGTYPGANGEPATIFTLGLLSDDPQLPIYLRDDIANRTPGGQFFYAQTIGDVGPMFSQIKYQIQRVILLNKSNRYNIDFS